MGYVTRRPGTASDPAGASRTKKSLSVSIYTELPLLCLEFLCSRVHRMDVNFSFNSCTVDTADEKGRNACLDSSTSDVMCSK